MTVEAQSSAQTEFSTFRTIFLAVFLTFGFQRLMSQLGSFFSKLVRPRR
jgi:hypothetical protein